MAHKSLLPEFGVVVAATVTGGIGLKGELPWRIKYDIAAVSAEQ